MFGRWLLSALLLTLATGQGGTPSLRLDVLTPAELRVGERTHLDIALTLPAAAASPVLVTPLAEGESLDVVRGRLLRADALDGAATPLRFRLPVVGRAPGTSVVRVHALAYVCSEAQCEAIESESRVSVMVLAP